MKILITGANGFVGSHIAEALIEKGNEVCCLVRKTSDCKWLKDLSVNYVYGDITDIKSLEDPIKQCDIVIHCAGVLRANKQEDYYKANHQGTLNLAKSILEFNPYIKKFIYISSQAAMGPSPQFRAKSLDEIENPLSDYGKSKLAGEKALKLLDNKVPYTILRPASVYGPRDKDIFIFFNLVHFGFRPVTSKKRFIQFLYVKDLAYAVIKVIDLNITDYKTYFLAEDNFYTWEDTGLTISEAINKKTIAIPLPDFIFRITAFFAETISRISGKAAVLNRQKITEMMQLYWLGDNSKSKKDLGLDFTKLKNGAKITYKWYENNKWF